MFPGWEHAGDERACERTGDAAPPRSAGSRRVDRAQRGRAVSGRGAALFGAMCVLWGIPYLLIKVAVAEVAVPVLVLARCAVGAAVLLPLALRPGAAALLRAHWRPLLAFAAVEIIGPWAL